MRPNVPILGKTGLLTPGTGSNIGTSNIVDYLLANGIRPITIGANDPLVLDGTLNALLLEQMGYAQDEWGNWVRLGPAIETTKDVTYANGGGGTGGGYYGGGGRGGGGGGAYGRVPGYTGNDRYSSAIGLVSWRI